MVMQMRRAVRFIAVLGLLLAAFTIGQTSSVAGVRSAAQEVCPGATSYPPSPGAIIMASTTTPFVGQTIEVSGKNYCPNEDVAIMLRGKKVGSTHTDASGRFEPPLKVSGPAGQAELAGIGASGLSLDRDSLELTIGAGTGVNPGSPSGTPGLALTGTELTGLIALAAVLLGGGGVMLYAGRRKRSVHS
jgi:hypothetical protein